MPSLSRHRLRRSLFEYFKSGFKIKNKILQVRVKRFAQRHLLEPEAKSIQGREYNDAAIDPNMASPASTWWYITGSLNKNIPITNSGLENGIARYWGICYSFALLSQWITEEIRTLNYDLNKYDKCKSKYYLLGYIPNIFLAQIHKIILCYSISESHVFTNTNIHRQYYNPL